MLPRELINLTASSLCETVLLRCREISSILSLSLVQPEYERMGKFSWFLHQKALLHLF